MAADDATGGDAPESIDPRYNPVFQRGYRGDVRRSLRAGVGRGERESGAQRVQREMPRPVSRPGSQPISRPLSNGEHAPDAPDAPMAGTDRRERESGSTTPNVDDDPSVDDEGAERYLPPPSTNPYVVALWVIGIALSVCGVLVQWWAQLSQFSGAFSVQNGVPLRVLLVSLANTVSGPMITVGMATIVGLIFMAATRSRNTSSRGRDAS
jgi:hypothetical protein